jgi:uncharacterized protein (TIGR03437 family)
VFPGEDASRRASSLFFVSGCGNVQRIRGDGSGIFLNSLVTQSIFMPMRIFGARVSDQRVKGKMIMYHLRLLRILPVLFALTVGSSYLRAVTITAATPIINLTCTQGSVCASSGTTNVSVGSGSGLFFTVTTPTVPWLSVTPASGSTLDTVATDTVITFSPSPGWTTLPVGLSTTTVQIKSTGTTSATVTVTIEVESATPTLSVQGGINVLNPVAYTAGAAAPTLSLTVVSSNGLPLAFTVGVNSSTTPEGIVGGVSGTGWLTTSGNGIAYSWGTVVTFAASAAATTQNALPGDTLTATITITPAGQAAVILPVAILVSAAAPTLTAVSPNIVPLLPSPQVPGTVTLVLHGTNFVSGTGIYKTKVFVGATLAAATQVPTADVTVLSSTYLTVTVPYLATGVPFATAGATAVLIGVNNGATPTAPATVSGTQTIAVTAAPIISQITSASSFVDSATPALAPYDIISIFGTNFCAGCTGTSSVLLGAPDPVFQRFPIFVSPDGTHKVSVSFSKPGTPATFLPGYILFATNNQINVLVPGALATLNLSGVNVTVGYDLVAPATAATAISAASLVTVALQDPGIFTIESNGQGQGAITDATTFILNSQAAPAVSGTSTVAIFMTGLGTPDSAVANIAAPSITSWSSDCIAPLGTLNAGAAVAGTATVAPTGYLDTVDTPYLSTFVAGTFQQASTYVVPATLWTSIDGAVINPAELNTGITAPCFLSTDTSATTLITVTFYGAATAAVTAATTTYKITYAGFVSSAVAGLYQINVQVPASVGTGTAAAYPVTVTMGSGGTALTSQAGVTLWVQ